MVEHDLCIVAKLFVGGDVDPSLFSRWRLCIYGRACNDILLPVF